MPQCKKPGPPLIIEYHEGSLKLESIYHPRGCMGARVPHLDVAINNDPCGLLEYFGKSGSCLPASRSGDGIVVDLSGLFGYPCTIFARGLPYTGRIYLMVSRSGKLYVAPC